MALTVIYTWLYISSTWVSGVPRGRAYTEHESFPDLVGMGMDMGEWHHYLKSPMIGNSLVVQWLGLCTFTAEVQCLSGN